MTKLTRGLKNNNPLNIRRNSDTWRGQRLTQTDKQFVQFDSITDGLRAAFVLIHTYMTRYGCNTISKIIRRWAPPKENRTDAYIMIVCERTKMKRTAVLDFFNEAEMVALVQGMAYVENGVIVPKKYITEGYMEALKGVI